MDELFEALRIIQTECKKHKKCEGCPLWNGYECFVIDTHSPDNWPIGELKNNDLGE